MKKLKAALWAVVFFYIAYAIYTDGPTTLMIGLLSVAVVVLLMQVWMSSDVRKRLHQRDK